jgi:hypothetical protein
VFDALDQGRIDAALLIHEGRLLYQERGYARVAELGEWWQGETGLPLPLGVNVIRRALGPAQLAEVSHVLRDAIRWALDNRSELIARIAGESRGDQALARPELLDRYLDMYANEDTLAMAPDVRRGIDELFNRARAAGLLSSVPVQWAPLVPVRKSMRHRTCSTSGLFVLAALAFAPVRAQAQPAGPKFSFVTPEPKVEEVVDKKLSARGGLVQLAGNSKVLTGTMGVQGAYQARSNRFSGEAGAAYSRSAIAVIADSNANMLVDEGELSKQSQTTSKLFQAKGRYDRFFTLNNSAYFSVQALSDVPAGKELVAGGQVGYSRQLYKDDRHRTVAELGYDFSLEQAAAANAELVQVHSARVYAAEELKLSDATGLVLNSRRCST